MRLFFLYTLSALQWRNSHKHPSPIPFLPVTENCCHQLRAGTVPLGESSLPGTSQVQGWKGARSEPRTLFLFPDLLFLTFFFFPLLSFQLCRPIKPWPRGTSTRPAPALGGPCSWLCSPSPSELAYTWAWPWPSLPTSPRTITCELLPRTKEKNSGPVLCPHRASRASRGETPV